MASSAAENTTAPNPPPRDSSTIAWDPEFMAVLATTHSAVANVLQTLPPATTALQLRANSDLIMNASLNSPAAAFPPELNDVLETTTEVTSFDGATITLTRFATAAQRAAPAPSSSSSAESPGGRRAVLHVHGGGYITGSVPLFAPRAKRNVLDWDTQVFAVGYRVAPESPAPGPVEDAWAALAWLSAHAAEMAIDPARIVLLGESAGGGIAAALALVARDRALTPPLAKVVLVYPMLDDRTCGRYGEHWPVREFLSWKEADNLLGWGAYLGEDRAGKADADVSMYDVAGRARVEDLVGLPKTYIDVGGLDLFRDEDVAYAARLLEANVETEFHLYPGVPHGFETAVTPGVVKAALENRRRAICSV